MTLKKQMKWRLNDLAALQALPEGSPERRDAEKRLFAEFTQPCAAEIMGAAPDSPLGGIARRRRLWARLGYALIVLFLATVAALVLGYWLVSDHRASWLGTRGLLSLLASPAIPRSERMEVLTRIFGEDLPSPMLALLRLMVSRGHAREIPRMMEE